MKKIMFALTATSLLSFNIFASKEIKAEAKPEKKEVRTPASTPECRAALEKAQQTGGRQDLRDAADTCSATFTGDDKSFYEKTLSPRCDAAMNGIKGSIKYDIQAGCLVSAVEFIFASQPGQD
jgi:hypothetical protein